MAIGNDVKTRALASVPANREVTTGPVAPAGSTQPAGTGRPSERAQAPEPIADPKLVKGVETRGVTIPATLSAAESRKLDIVQIVRQAGKGQAEVKLHLVAGQKIAGARIPEGMYVVMTVAAKENGEADFAKSSMHFENAKGEKVVLDRERSIFDVVGASLSKDGQVLVDVALSPFDVDVTKKLLGVDHLPEQLHEILALALVHTGGGGGARVIDTKDVSYSGFFTAKRGTLDLAGDSAVELHRDAKVFFKGNAEMGMLQLNTPEDGASLKLASSDGNHLRTGPSTLNLRVGFLAKDNERFFMFDTSTLNAVEVRSSLLGSAVTFNVSEVKLQGHAAPAPTKDLRFAGLEAAATAAGISVPPSEVRGSDVELQVARKFIAKWPLDTIAQSKPESMARLLKDPNKKDVTGFPQSLFAETVVAGAKDGLGQVPYFIHDRLKKMSDAELAVVVQRAVLADLAERWKAAPEEWESREQAPGQQPTKADLAAQYRREVTELRGMLVALRASTRDKAMSAELDGMIARASDQRDVAKDAAVLAAADESLRPSPELPPHDAFALKFKRDGSLDENIRDVILPKLIERAAKKGIDITKERTVHLDSISLKPGVQPLAFMALTHPLVKQALSDPTVRALATQARGSVEKLAAGFLLMRAEDAGPAQLERGVAGGLDAALGMTREQALAFVRRLPTLPPVERRAAYARLNAAGSAVFEMGKAELRQKFLDLGGMEPNGRAEAFLNLVIDEVIKADFLPQAAVEKLQSERNKFIEMALNAARAAIWVRTQPGYRDWRDLGSELVAKVAQSDDRRSAVGSAKWMGELESLTGSKLQRGNDVKTFASGAEMFADLKAAIRSAPAGTKILCNYWGVYDDESGRQFAELVKEAKARGCEVALIVDGKTAMSAGIGKKSTLPALQAAGIPVTYWNDAAQPPVGNHVKFTLMLTPRLDGTYAPKVWTGGSNIGDNYTHEGTPATKWSDANASVTGAGAVPFLGLYKTLLGDAPMPMAIDEKKIKTSPGGSAEVMLIHDKPIDGQNPILLANFKMLEGAKAGDTVTLWNAYFVMTEPIRMALERALARGVNVEILTNSPKSVDEPVVAKPIMDSIREALRIAERVGKGKVSAYVPHMNLENPEQSDLNTVHDKVTVAGDAVAVMSYNMHPRSETLEHEIVTLVVDKAAADAQRARIAAFKTKATAISSSDHALFAAFPLGAEDLALEVFKNIF